MRTLCAVSKASRSAPSARSQLPPPIFQIRMTMLAADLHNFERAIQEAITRATSDEATLTASWPASATATQVKALFRGTVVRVTDGTGNVSIHAALPGAVADSGELVVAAFAPPLAGGPQLTRNNVNGSITGFIPNILSDLDANGVVVVPGPQLASYGLSATIFSTPGRSDHLTIRFAGAGNDADTVAPLTAMHFLSFSRFITHPVTDSTFQVSRH